MQQHTRRQELKAKRRYSSASVRRKRSSPSNGCLQGIQAPIQREEEVKVSIMEVVKEFKTFMVPMALENFIATCRLLLYFVFLRTTIKCTTATPDDFDRNSRDWSGSKYCSDRCEVASEAQLLMGISEGIEQVAQFLMLPFLGVLSDAFGRRLTLTITEIGLTASTALLAVAAMQRTGPLIAILVFSSAAVRGFTNSFTVSTNAAVADLFQETKTRGHVYGVLQVYVLSIDGLATVIITASVISQNRYNYDDVFWALSGLAFLNAVVIPLTIDETIGSREPVTCARALPSSMIRVLRNNPSVAWIALTVFFFIFAVNVLTIAQAFVISAYGWTQTIAIIVLIAVGTVGFCAAMFAPKMIDFWGPRDVFRWSMVGANVGFCIMVFSSFSPVFFIIGVVPVALAIVAIPAYRALMTEQVADGDMGLTLGAVGSVSLAAQGVSAPVYAAIFKAVGSGGDCGGSGIQEMVWAPWGLAAMSMIAGNITLNYWMKTYPPPSTTPGRAEGVGNVEFDLHPIVSPNARQSGPTGNTDVSLDIDSRESSKIPRNTAHTVTTAIGSSPMPSPLPLGSPMQACTAPTPDARHLNAKVVV
uniref:Major facilitator superfamily (MFS) profile domain-containing protein n=1 Tax=Lotharella globosa TaxID=91324 RepID=A0A7S3YTJ5_9EUKA|mmetsp:Transcript_12179/g.24591  ORF Transcript_12179/g.24591 Transcript_12179/m.24591 type:complete len:588 (+) Transcript_12179:461-2224(+)